MELCASSTVPTRGRPDSGPEKTGTRATRRRAVLRLAAAVALLATLTLTPTAQSRTTANLSLDVTFFTTGAISVTLPDGTAVGTQSGSPTSVPAGYYTVYLTGPGGCAELPYFDLQGPGVNVRNNLQDGEVMSTGFVADFLPSSTYTWVDEATTPAVTHTFVTSADVVGSPPITPSPVPSSSTMHTTTVSTQDVVGSGLPAIRGTLTGTVSAAGTLTLAYAGKSVTSLKPGRYKLTVIDKSKASGFILEATNRPAMTVTATRTFGTRTLTITLTAGRWFVTPRLLGKKLSFSVS